MTEAFDRLAHRYDAWYATPLGTWADRLEAAAMFRLLAVRAGERLLDLGTGTGCYAIAAARRGALVTAVDASPAMLTVARSNAEGTTVTLVQADLTALPFADASFDAAMAVTALCFVASPAAMLREAARVLRPGGRLIVGELNRWSVWALVRRVEGLLRPTIYRHARFYGIAELRALLAAAELQTTRWVGVLHLPPINSAAILAALDPIERLGQRYAPALGAFLAIAASKPNGVLGPVLRSAV